MSNEQQVKIKKEKQPLDPGQKIVMIVLGSIAAGLAILGIVLIAVL